MGGDAVKRQRIAMIFSAAKVRVMKQTQEGVASVCANVTIHARAVPHPARRRIINIYTWSCTTTTSCDTVGLRA